MKPLDQGLMPTYQIIKFEIPVHNCISISRKVVSHILDDLVIFLVGSAQYFPRSDIFDPGLLSLDSGPRVAVTGEESVFLAVTREPNSVRIESMKPCECLNGGKPTSRGRPLSMAALSLRVFHDLRLSSVAW